MILPFLIPRPRHTRVVGRVGGLPSSFAWTLGFPLRRSAGLAASRFKVCCPEIGWFSDCCGSSPCCPVCFLTGGFLPSLLCSSCSVWSPEFQGLGSLGYLVHLCGLFFLGKNHNDKLQPPKNKAVKSHDQRYALSISPNTGSKCIQFLNRPSATTPFRATMDPFTGIG